MAKVSKLNDKVWQELKAKIGRLADEGRVKVGVLESRGGADMHPDAGIGLAELAAIHEYGSPAAGIPARSFIRRPFMDETGRVALNDFLYKLAKAVIAEKVSPRNALDMLGTWAVTQIKNRIVAHIPPPNAPITIKRKGSSTPLVDTGVLLNSITWEIKP